MAVSFDSVNNVANITINGRERHIKVEQGYDGVQETNGGYVLTQNGEATDVFISNNADSGTDAIQLKNGDTYVQSGNYSLISGELQSAERRSADGTGNIIESRRLDGLERTGKVIASGFQKLASIVTTPWDGGAMAKEADSNWRTGMDTGVVYDSVATTNGTPLCETQASDNELDDAARQARINAGLPVTDTVRDRVEMGGMERVGNLVVGAGEVTGSILTGAFGLGLSTNPFTAIAGVPIVAGSAYGVSDGLKRLSVAFTGDREATDAEIASGKAQERPETRVIAQG